MLAPAKVNLGLKVIGRREDGYHLLDSLVVFADIGDRLEASLASDLSLTVTGPEAASLQAEAPENNLVLRAATALRQAAGVTVGAHLTLEKHLPVASGIGGGSADAAAALHLLNRLWKLNWSLPQLQTLGLKLGADVPVCLAGQTCRMQGIGEQLTPVRLEGVGAILLANPRVVVSTRDIFKKLQLTNSHTAAVRPCYTLTDIHRWPNDLQPVAIEQEPAIAALLQSLQQLPDVLHTGMSGSGATCFALFKDLVRAETALQLLRRQRPADWMAAGHLLER